MFVSYTNREVGGKYLVSGHRKRVDVALLRRVAVREAELGWVQQLRSHVTDSSRFGGCHALWLHNSAIDNNRCDPKVSEARVTLLSDKYIPLAGQELMCVCL